MSKRILVTGAAGFIGFHVAERLLQDGHSVLGIDSMSAYYDVRLKEARVALLQKYDNFTFVQLSVAQHDDLLALCREWGVGEIVHLAAQPGVRYSLVNPFAYAESNYLGTLSVFEVARELHIPRVVYASSSSVYGVHDPEPFRETDRTDVPMSLYAASKKANEVLAHSYNHLFGIETIGLRFFTVYGTWGRPDMAIFKFTRSAILGEPIDLYNHGQMKRSFTHVSDIVEMIMRVVAAEVTPRDMIYNVGGAEALPLASFVQYIEDAVGRSVEKKYLPLQAGDVPDTIADCSRAASDYGYTASVDARTGITAFVEWFLEHKEFLVSLERSKQ